MKNLDFENAEFIHSALDEKLFPHFKNDRGEPFPEIVISGKSNVGKSSLINHLLNKKNLAFTSSKPGKTKTINFFKVDGKIILLDFPGYGFAHQPLHLKEEWAKNFDIFLNTRQNIKLFLLLMDSRRELGEEDLTFFRWAKSKDIPCGVILTKSDKLKKMELDKSLQSIPKRLEELSLSPPYFCISYSINEPTGKKILSAKIKALLGDI